MKKNFILYTKDNIINVEEIDTPLQAELVAKQLSKEKAVDVFVCEAKSVMQYAPTTDKKEIE